MHPFLYFLQILHLFERNLSLLLSSFTADAKQLFERARVVDTRFYRRLSELAEALEEAPFKEQEDDQNDEMNTSSSSSSSSTNEIQAAEAEESIAVLITRCHDSHQVKQLAKN